MRKKIIYAVLIALGISKIGYSQSYQFSLQQAIEYAYQNQHDIKNAALDAEISKNKVKETVAIGLPQVTGSAAFQKFIDIPTQTIPNFISPLTGAAPGTYPEFIEAKFGTNYTANYGIQVSQLLFDGNYLI